MDKKVYYAWYEKDLTELANHIIHIGSGIVTPERTKFAIQAIEGFLDFKSWEKPRFVAHVKSAGEDLSFPIRTYSPSRCAELILQYRSMSVGERFVVVEIFDENGKPTNNVYEYVMGIGRSGKLLPFLVEEK